MRITIMNQFRELYDSYENKTSKRNKKKQVFLKRVSLVHIPIAVISFTVIYWLIGLKSAKFF